MTKANFFSLYIMLVLNVIVTIGAFVAGQMQVALITAGFVVLMAVVLMVRRKQAREAAQSVPAEPSDESRKES